MHTIDLNSDLGEGIGNDAQIMPYITSANIATGYHAGDVETIINTIMLAEENGVAVGAHPSFPDRENFGRTEMHLPDEEIFELVSLQVNFMTELCRAAGLKLRHVKPHGALYNMSARDAKLANTIARAIHTIDPTLMLYGLSGSHSITEARAVGLQSVNEVFADRTYQDDGSLTPRNIAGAVIEDTDQAIIQALSLVKENKVKTVTGKLISLKAETICLHGDGSHAVEFAKKINQRFRKEQINIDLVPGIRI